MPLSIGDQPMTAPQMYLTTDELAERIRYDARTIRNQLKDSVLLEGIHYFRPFGGRKILYVWDAIERDMKLASAANAPLVPLSAGGAIHG
jgi:hypothetical protein